MFFEVDTTLTDSFFSGLFTKEAMRKNKKPKSNKKRRSQQRRQQSGGKNKARRRAQARAQAPSPSPAPAPKVAPTPAPTPAPAPAPIQKKKISKSLQKIKASTIKPKAKKPMLTKGRIGGALGATALAGGLVAGYKKLKGGQEKTAEFDVKDPQHRAALAAGLGGAATPGGLLIPGAAAAYAAEKGRGWPTYGGATIGGLAGATLGHVAGGGRLGRVAGGALGAAGGAYAMHGPTGEMPAYKEASVAELSALADLLQAGQLGEEAQYAFEGMTEGIESYIQEEVPEKTASAYETDYTIYDESAARIARLETLLKKY